MSSSRLYRLDILVSLDDGGGRGGRSSYCVREGRGGGVGDRSSGLCEVGGGIEEDVGAEEAGATDVPCLDIDRHATSICLRDVAIWSSKSASESPDDERVTDEIAAAISRAATPASVERGAGEVCWGGNATL